MDAVPQLLRVHDGPDRQPFRGVAAVVHPFGIRFCRRDPSTDREVLYSNGARAGDRRSGRVSAAVRWGTVSGHHRYRVVRRGRVARNVVGDERMGAVQCRSRAAASAAYARRGAISPMTRTSVALPLAALAIALALIVAAIKLVLRAPGIPYNVSELFLDDASVVSVGFFALGLIWIGAGAMLTALVLTNSRRPYLVLPIAILVVSLISKML